MAMPCSGKSSGSVNLYAAYILISLVIVLSNSAIDVIPSCRQKSNIVILSAAKNLVFFTALRSVQNDNSNNTSMNATRYKSSQTISQEINVRKSS